VAIQTNIISVIRNEGIELKQSGKAYVGCCPFHDDKHPSFYAYPDSNRFICYGCGERGDAIDFIMKIKGLPFKEARQYLKLDWGNTVQENGARQSRRKELIKQFREWCNQYYDALAREYRCINKITSTFKAMEEAEQCACLYHRLPELEWYMDILLFGDDEQKYFLYKDITHEI
jgi:hypothetical protein